MKRSLLNNRLVQKSLLTCGIASLATSIFIPDSAIAQVTTLPSGTNLVFQTSGPSRCASVGDWYTTLNPLGCPVNGGTTPSNLSSRRRHEFLVNITAADLAAAGGTVSIRIEDAESNTPPGGELVGAQFDEVDGNGIGNFAVGQTPDPTRFQLLAPGGAVLDSQVVPSGSANGTQLNFTVTAPGAYTVTSETGALPISGDPNPALNNDDNGFRIVVTGVTGLLIGQFQGTFQNAVVGAANYDFFVIVGPSINNIFLRNFDLDVPADPASISYTNPTNGTIAGTTSGNAVWNGGLNNLDNGGDSVPVTGLANSGSWRVTLANYGSFTNQSLLEINAGTAPDPNQRLPVFDTPPTRAGNLVVERTATPPFPSNGAVCYAFTVRNLFFTSDIINLDFNPNDPNFTSQFRDANGQNPLTDTDGDGRPDTGILQPNESRTYTVCVTAGPNAPPQFDFNIGGISFIDARIRQQAGNTPATRQSSVNFSLGGQAVTTTSSFRLVKRITSITRNGTSLPGVNFGVFVDDPGTTEDNDPGWAQTQLLGILNLPVDNPVRSGDEVTYTVYFLASGSSPLLDTSICDQIPGGTSFIPGSLQLSQANLAPRSVGEFFTPLAPLPDNNSCAVQTNPNGSTVTSLGTVSNTPGSNFGFTRFRVRVN